MDADTDVNQLDAAARAPSLAAPPAPSLSSSRHAPKPIFKQISALSAASSSDVSQRLDQLRDVELDVRIELGRTRLRLADLLALDEGAVVEMDKLAGEPVEIFASDRLVARGEVMVHGERLCVRVSEILDSGQKR